MDGAAGWMRAIGMALACAAAVPATAVTMYRWVDERGVTHVADHVPPAYKAKATRVESVTYDVPEASRREAVQRAAQLASAAAAGPVAPRAAASAAGSGSGVAAGVRKGTAIAPPLPTDTDCATLQRRYAESLRCFDNAPKTIYGSTNAARTPECVAVTDPSPRCGPPNVDAQWRRPP